MKAETTYMKTLGKVEAKLSRMKEQAAAVRWFYENGNLLESYNRALRLEELSEQTVLLTRVLPAYTGAVGATTQTDAIISDTIPVEVGFTAEGWFSIRIPALLPKKASGSADYIRSYLYPAMRKFFEGTAAVLLCTEVQMGSTATIPEGPCFMCVPAIPNATRMSASMPARIFRSAVWPITSCVHCAAQRTIILTSFMNQVI